MPYDIKDADYIYYLVQPTYFIPCSLLCLLPCHEWTGTKICKEVISKDCLNPESTHDTVPLLSPFRPFSPLISYEV